MWLMMSYIAQLMEQDFSHCVPPDEDVRQVLHGSTENMTETMVETNVKVILWHSGCICALNMITRHSYFHLLDSEVLFTSIIINIVLLVWGWWTNLPAQGDRDKVMVWDFAQMTRHPNTLMGENRWDNRWIVTEEGRTFLRPDSWAASEWDGGNPQSILPLLCN